MPFRNKPRNTARRRELRRDATAAEVVLWNVLRRKQLDGRRFRRQDDLGPYIVDFICAAERLVIELDGQHHYTPLGMANDAVRDEFMVSRGISCHSPREQGGFR